MGAVLADVRRWDPQPSTEGYNICLRDPDLAVIGFLSDALVHTMCWRSHHWTRSDTGKCGSAAYSVSGRFTNHVDHDLVVDPGNAHHIGRESEGGQVGKERVKGEPHGSCGWLICPVYTIT